MPGSHEHFATTRWSMVVAATARRETDAAPPELAELCQVYWPPLYAFARQRGHQPADAQDLTQAFFEHLLSSSWIGEADAERGRFRTFLLTAFTRFATSQWRKTQAQKRGGQLQQWSLDTTQLADCVVEQDGDPECIFRRRWATTVLENVVQDLEREYQAKGKETLFQTLRPLLIPGGQVPSYHELAASLSISNGAARVAAHRLRERYREILRRRVGETVCSPDEIDDEIRELMRSFQKSV